MSKSCTLKPTVLVNSKQVPSKLFEELTRYYGGGAIGRKLAWEAYEIAKAPFIIDKLKGIQFDEYGEPTLESLDNAINLNSFITDENNIGKLEREIKATNNNGERILYDSINQIINTIINFNREHPSVIATINKVKDKYSITVEKRTIENESNVNKVIFNNNVNNQLQAILNRAGFAVKIDSTLEYHGIFNPFDVSKTADGLRTIIRIAKGEQGESAFPEEFSHFIIEGLRTDPFVQRLLNFLKPEIVQNVLGEDYEKYSQLYENDEYLLQREAAAKVLQSHLTGQPISINPPKTLLQRLWEKVKSVFSKISLQDIDKAYINADKGFSHLADAVLDESIIPLIDFSKVDRDSKILYNTNKTISRLQKDVEEALAVASKRLLIRKSREKSGGKIDDSEIEALKNLKIFITKKQYTKGCLAFLKSSLSQINNLQKELKGKLDKSTMNQIRSNSRTLREIKEFSEGYTEIIKEMKSMPLLLEMGIVDISEEDAKKIAELASEIGNTIDNLMTLYEEKRYETLLHFLKIYYGDEKIINAGANKGQKLSIEKIMEMATHDINFLDNFISSMSDASDPILSITDKIVTDNNNERDDELKEIFNEIKVIDAELKEAGYSSDFMYERDSEGNLTGNYISDRNITKYYEARRDFIEQLKKQGLDKAQIKAKLIKWEQVHTEDIRNPYNKNIVERVPSKDIFPSDALKNLSEAQRTYYDKMIAIKQKLQTYIPQRYGKTYLAVQIPASITESVSITDPKHAAKTFFESMKDKFVRREFDLDYGESMLDEPTKRVILNFSGNPLQKLPVYYTGRLKDMSRLSTDCTSSMIAYASMAVNYSHMSEIIDSLELLREFVKDRKVQQKYGNKNLQEAYTVMATKFKKPYAKTGRDSNIGERMDNYFASVIYGEHKADKMTIRIPGTETDIDVGKTLDALKEYTSIVGLGVNVFSGISNITMGTVNAWIDAIGGEYYNAKNLLKAEALYYTLLPNYLAELNIDSKSSKMSLLIDKFDALEEFYSNLKNTTYKGPLRRLLGNMSLLFMQNAGEHYLHTRGMFAILDSEKVNVNGKEVSLYEALDTIDKTTKSGRKVGGEIIFKEGAKLSDGTELFSIKHYRELESLVSKQDKQSKERIQELLSMKNKTEHYFNSVKNKINKVNQSINGAFKSKDKGAIHRHALGRLVMQFRQWMPAHYYRRFAGTYYDAQLDQWREGYYRTLGKFLLNLLVDLKEAKFQVATNWENLSAHEKANIKRALAEITIFATTAITLALSGPISKKKQKNNTWAKRMAQYQLRRIYLETGASIPLTPDFFQNITTMLQSPAAAISSFNNIASLIEFWNIFEEIESGKYKGWSVYERDLVTALPIYGQLRKAIDLQTETYMFNVFSNAKW